MPSNIHDVATGFNNFYCRKPAVIQKFALKLRFLQSISIISFSVNVHELSCGAKLRHVCLVLLLLIIALVLYNQA